MAVGITYRGGAPRIDGTRINVYDVLFELRMGSSPTQIAETYLLTDEEVQAALRYIEENREQVESDYQKILERHRRGNPPEIQAKLDAIRASHAPMWAEFRRRRQALENGNAGNSDGH